MSRLTVVGSFAVGLTIRTPEMPIFGQTILGSDFDFGPGGKGSNQAVGLARLGMDVGLVTCVGKDELANVALNLYREEGVGSEFVIQDDRRATGAGVIVLNSEGNNFIILDMGANELMDRPFVEQARDRIATSDVVMAVLEIPVEAACTAMEIGKSGGARTILNPAPATALPDHAFEHVDYLTPNESELRILLGLSADDRTGTRDLAMALRERGVGTVIVTMGPEGALVLGPEADTVVPSPQVEVVDTTGAGDAFNAGFAAALAEGQPLLSSIAVGTAAGAHACTRLGVIPSLARRKELVDFSQRTNHHNKGSLNETW
jgi:ribokinase